MYSPESDQSTTAVARQWTMQHPRFKGMPEVEQLLVALRAIEQSGNRRLRQPHNSAVNAVRALELSADPNPTELLDTPIAPNAYAELFFVVSSFQPHLATSGPTLAPMIYGTVAAIDRFNVGRRQDVSLADNFRRMRNDRTTESGERLADVLADGLVDSNDVADRLMSPEAIAQLDRDHDDDVRIASLEAATGRAVLAIVETRLGDFLACQLDPPAFLSASNARRFGAAVIDEFVNVASHQRFEEKTRDETLTEEAVGALRGRTTKTPLIKALETVAESQKHSFDPKFLEGLATANYFANHQVLPAAAPSSTYTFYVRPRDFESDPNQLRHAMARDGYVVHAPAHDYGAGVFAVSTSERLPYVGKLANTLRATGIELVGIDMNVDDGIAVDGARLLEAFRPFKDARVVAPDFAIGTADPSAPVPRGLAEMQILGDDLRRGQTLTSLFE